MKKKYRPRPSAREIDLGDVMGSVMSWPRKVFLDVQSGTWTLTEVYTDPDYPDIRRHIFKNRAEIQSVCDAIGVSTETLKAAVRQASPAMWAQLQVSFDEGQS